MDLGGSIWFWVTALDLKSIFWLPQVSPCCLYYLFVYKNNNFIFILVLLKANLKILWLPQVDPYCPYFLFVYKHNNFIWDNEGKRNFILVLLHANFTYLDVLTSVLSENSMKEVLLLLFSELLAQPGRACLLCFTPEFDKVLVSLAHRCLGASLCQIRELSAIGWFAQVAWDLPMLPEQINLVAPYCLILLPPLDKVFPLTCMFTLDMYSQMDSLASCVFTVVTLISFTFMNWLCVPFKMAGITKCLTTFLTGIFSLLCSFDWCLLMIF